MGLNLINTEHYCGENTCCFSWELMQSQKYPLRLTELEGVSFCLRILEKQAVFRRYHITMCLIHSPDSVWLWVCVLYIKHRVYRKKQYSSSKKCTSGLRKNTATGLKKNSHSVDIWQERLSHKIQWNTGKYGFKAAWSLVSSFSSSPYRFQGAAERDTKRHSTSLC